MKLAIKGNIVKSGVTSSTLYIEDGRIVTKADSCELLDLSDCYIFPSFVELHAHGASGYDFIDNTMTAFDAILDSHLSHGVGKLCPTLCSCEFDEVLKFLSLCENVNRTEFVGVHLEGPFLSPKMCGAQNLSCIIEPSEEKINSLKKYSHLISRITAAPEIDGVLELPEIFPDTSFSIGHSNADAKKAHEALSCGFDSVTHLFCSTSGRHKEGSFVRGGIIEEALLSDCYVELIGDGHHVSRESLLLTLKCKGANKVCLVSDAMRAAGSTADGESYLGAIKPENRVILEDGVAKLPDRSSFAGSLAVGDTMVKAMVDYDIPLETISEMMSGTPSALLGLSDIGELKPGKKANITILDKNFDTVYVFNEGKIIYSRK